MVAVVAGSERGDVRFFSTISHYYSATHVFLVPFKLNTYHYTTFDEFSNSFGTVKLLSVLLTPFALSHTLKLEEEFYIIAP